MPGQQNKSQQALPVYLADDDLNPLGGASPLTSKTIGGGSMAHNQVAVTTSATLVAAARAGRLSITITSTSAVVFYVGNSNVTAANGAYVAGAAGASITLSTSAAVYAVGAANVTLSYVEVF